LQEKKSASIMLVQASDFQTAVKNLNENMRDTMSDWEINAITETTLMDVYMFDAARIPAQAESAEAPKAE
jgi:hypothetical protein